MPVNNITKTQYVTWRIAPIIRRHIKDIVSKWQNNNNRKWSVSALVNAVFLNWLDNCDRLNDKEIEGLLEKYRDLDWDY